MIVFGVVSVLLALGGIVYLGFALLKPERF